jgi:hypothetical protein
MHVISGLDAKLVTAETFRYITCEMQMPTSYVSEFLGLSFYAHGYRADNRPYVVIKTKIRGSLTVARNQLLK